MSNIQELQQVAAGLGFSDVADAAKNGWTPTDLMALMGSKPSDTAPAKAKADWRNDVRRELSSMTKNGKKIHFFSDVIGFTPSSTPTEGWLVGYDKNDAAKVRAIPYHTPKGTLRAYGHVKGTVAELQAILDTVADSDLGPINAKPKAPRSRQAKAKAINGPTAAELADLGAKTLRAIADAAGLEFGPKVDRRKVADLSDAMAAAWDADLADAMATLEATAKA